MAHWYALQCPTGKEAQIRQLLIAKYPSLQTLLPARELLLRRQGKLQSEIRPLFPGYLLLCCADRLTRQKASQITRNAIPSGNLLFARFLGMDDDGGDSQSPLREIHPAEMSFILELCSESEIISLSRFIKEGERVKIVSGPLRGREGELIALNLRKKRARLRLTFLGQERLVDLGLEQLSTASRT